MIDLAPDALALYELPEAATATLTLLRHNENRTYRVACGGQAYCLRIKQPVAGFDLSVLVGDPEALLEGELDLLDILRRETDLVVPEPVPSRTGRKVVRLRDGSLASLLIWLDGVPFDSAERTAPMLFEAGRTLATLRTAAESHPEWNAVPRLSYDRALAERLIERAQRATGILPAETVASMVAALEQIARVMEEQERSEGRHLSHADPGFGNLVWTGDKVGLIDWSLSGSAPSCMDLGGLMGATADRAEQHRLLEGWESVRGTTDRRCLDACFGLSVLLFVCCQYPRAREWTDWFPAALTRWNETIFTPLAEGRRLTCIL